jgi:hypothetical protein
MAIPSCPLLLRSPARCFRTHPPYGKRFGKICPGKSTRVLELLRIIVAWLEYYGVLRGLPAAAWNSISYQIIAFGDNRREKSLHRNEDQIVSEFSKLEENIREVMPRNKNGEARDAVSLTSKALWLCFPDDIPIYDANALTGLKVISRLCHWASPDRTVYVRFVHLWLQAYSELEPIIDRADLSGCPYKVRVLDRVLWYLGKAEFYDEAEFR